MPFVCGVSASKPPRKTARHRDQAAGADLHEPARADHWTARTSGFRPPRSPSHFLPCCAERRLSDSTKRWSRLSSIRYCVRHALDIVERHLLNRVEIIAAEIQIPGQQPVRTEIGRLAAHGGQRAEMMAERNLLRLASVPPAVTPHCFISSMILRTSSRTASRFCGSTVASMPEQYPDRPACRKTPRPQ